ncbi:zinc finger protein 782-like [Leptidea sinapis]|uniref:zinc finger protein 782-like n=1 Tax=Leptidea sinapis TaxID=189913 RepID=UPI002134B702|nr:zinc finger protein 782-like [Leptidea sinapis]
MDSSPVTMSFNKLCRLCALEQDATLAASEELRSKIMKYIDIEVKDEDNLPKNICANCCAQLNTVCSFIDSAQEAQNSLNKIICGATKIETSAENNLSRKEKVRDKITYLNGIDGENVTLRLIGSEITLSEINPHTDEEKFNVIKEGQKPFLCKVCCRRFCTEIALKNHTWTHDSQNFGSARQYKCAICEEEFDRKIDMDKHTKQHKDTCICSICNRVFHSQWNLKKHLAIHTSKKKLYTCADCSRTYSTLSSFKTHQITHSTDRPYSCNFCSKRFKRFQELRYHMYKHTGEKPFNCLQCQENFVTRKGLYIHYEKEHPGKNWPLALISKNILLM